MQKILKKLFSSNVKHANISEKRGFIKNLDKLQELVQTPNADKKISNIHLGFSSNYSSLQTIEVDPEKFITNFAEEGILIDSKHFYTDLSGKQFLDPIKFPNKKFLLKPDLTTMRNMGWTKNNSILVFGDIYDPETGELSEISPRNMLKKKLELLNKKNLTLNCASELEFYLYQKSYSENVKKGLDNLKSIGSANEDYLIQQGDLLEYINEDFRLKIKDSGIDIETTKGEASQGQHEINMKYSQAMPQADNALVLKAGCKAIAETHKANVTFMAKPFFDSTGSSCHLHLSLYDPDGKNIFNGDDYKLTENLSCSMNLLYFLGGIMKYALDTFVMFAPTINSYRRYKAFSWAPSNLDSWSYDNRTSPFRVCGTGKNLRVEYRIPGGDANQYLAYSAVITAGLKGLEDKIMPPEIFAGSSYHGDQDYKRPPTDLNSSLKYFKNSDFIKESFSKNEVEFLTRFFDNEVLEYETSVTDLEQKRYFNQI